MRPVFLSDDELEYYRVLYPLTLTRGGNYTKRDLRLELKVITESIRSTRKITKKQRYEWRKQGK